MALNQIQLAALLEIERQVSLIRLADVPSTIPVEGTLQESINRAPAGSILDLLGKEYKESIKVPKPLTLHNGTVLAPPNANEIIEITGDRVNFTKMRAIGDGSTTKNGVIAHGTNMDLEIEIRNIRRAGQETHAIVMWDSVGPLKVRNSVLEAGSIGFLAGGGIPTIPNTIPTNLSFDNCLFTRPIEWKGQGWNCKNAFELKNARNVTVTNSILENCWKEGQQGYGIVLLPSASESIKSPLTTVENVLFNKCEILNCANGVNAGGYTQHPEFPTQRGNNYKFIDCDWDIKSALGGQGGLVMFSWEPKDVHFISNRVREDGAAFIRIGDRKDCEGIKFEDNTINFVGTYGIFAPDGNIRGLGWENICPGGIMFGNTFTGAHVTFKSNFPNNTYV